MSETKGSFQVHCTPEGYVNLYDTLVRAFNQAAYGKGKERHANNRPFEKQPILEIARMVGIGYPLGQAMKKTQETITLQKIRGEDAAIAELYGAINYLAAAVILLEEQKTAKEVENGMQ